MPELSTVSGARVRPRGSRRELAIWVVIRLSGLALFVLALAHFSVLHFIWDPAEQDAEFIIEQRWSQGLLRLTDWAMLMLVLAHSFLGMRNVLSDHIGSARARTVAYLVLYFLAVLLFALGTWVVVNLPGPGGQA
jgi:succinate dehydrogenase / fumarate reductase membrane anchor subunit